MTAWSEVLGWGEEEIEDLRFVGFSYLKQGKYDIAVPIFEALILIPSQTTAYDWQTLGALYLEKGDNFKALNTLERALKLDPNHEQTLLNRTKALFALGYRRQGLAQAKQLQLHSNREISQAASALLLAYT